VNMSPVGAVDFRPSRWTPLRRNKNFGPLSLGSLSHPCAGSLPRRTRTAHERGTGYQPLQVFFHVLARRQFPLRSANRLNRSRARSYVISLFAIVIRNPSYQVRRFRPLKVPEHHLRDRIKEPGLHDLCRESGGGAMRCFKHCQAVADVAARGNTMPPTWAARASEMSSPLRFNVAMTSYSSGRNNTCCRKLSASRPSPRCPYR